MSIIFRDCWHTIIQEVLSIICQVYGGETSSCAVISHRSNCSYLGQCLTKDRGALSCKIHLRDGGWN